VAAQRHSTFEAIQLQVTTRPIAALTAAVQYGPYSRMVSQPDHEQSRCVAVVVTALAA
jgi:hypothetical protein